MFLPSNSLIKLSDFFLCLRKKITASLDFFGPQARFYRNARAALWSGLQHLDIQPPATVWLPAFICNSILDPIVKQGLKYQLYDIDAHLEPQWDSLNAQKGDCVLFVHFFGIKLNIQKMADYCREKQAWLIEDCAHSLFDPQDPNPIGQQGDIVIYSLRKQLPVPDGGVLILNHSNKPLPQPVSLQKGSFFKNSIKIGLMICERCAFLMGVNMIGLKQKIKSLIGSTNQGFKLETLEPASALSFKIAQSLNIDQRIYQKQNNYKMLVELVKDASKLQLPIAKLPEGSCPQVFPIWVKDKKLVCNWLQKSGIQASFWPGDEKLANVNWPEFPGSQKWMDDLVLLPINENLQPRHLSFLAHCLTKIHDPI